MARLTKAQKDMLKAHEVTMKGRKNPFMHGKTSPSGVAKAKGKKPKATSKTAAVSEAAQDAVSNSPSRVSPSSVAPQQPVVDISSLPIPQRNPFFIASEMERRNIKYSTTSPDDVEINTAPTLDSPPADLFLAGTINYFRTDLEYKHDNDGRRAKVGAYYARYHWYPENEMADYFIPARYDPISDKTQQARDGLLSWATKFQASIMSIYFLGIRLLVDAMGGLTAWRSSTMSQRVAIFKTVWKSDEVNMAKTMLGMVAGSVPITDIFSKNSPDHTNWQKFHRTMFLWGAETTYMLRVHPTTDERLQCYNTWKAMARDPKLASLDLGGVADIPIKRAADTDTNLTLWDSDDE